MSRFASSHSNMACSFFKCEYGMRAKGAVYTHLVSLITHADNWMRTMIFGRLSARAKSQSHIERTFLLEILVGCFWRDERRVHISFLPPSYNRTSRSLSVGALRAQKGVFFAYFFHSTGLHCTALPGFAYLFEFPFNFFFCHSTCKRNYFSVNYTSTNCTPIFFIFRFSRKTRI